MGLSRTLILDTPMNAELSNSFEEVHFLFAFKRNNPLPAHTLKNHPGYALIRYSPFRLPKTPFWSELMFGLNIYIYILSRIANHAVHQTVRTTPFVSPNAIITYFYDIPLRWYNIFFFFLLARVLSYRFRVT